MLHHGTRLALFASALLAGTAATAQVSPEIAYAKGGSRAEIHLTNADGTGRRALYRGQSRTESLHVDIRPGGGELAFEEHVRGKPGTPVASAIKVINYDANGSVVGPLRTLQLTCLTGSVDYHPTDGTLLYRNCATPSRISRLNTATMASTDLGLSHDAFVAAWLDATHLLYYANAKYWSVSTADLTAPTEVVSWPSAGSLDPATSGAKVLVSGFEEIRLLDIAAGTIPHLLGGHKAHFSPDDQYFAYITSSAGPQYILIRRTDGAGSPANLTGKGTYTALDWRN